jgi:DNA-binding MarR family transcriptional regulator
VNLTEQHIAVLTYISRFRPTVYGWVQHFQMRHSTASMMRNRFREEGLIYDWENYGDRIEITDAGRKAIGDKP